MDTNDLSLAVDDAVDVAVNPDKCGLWIVDDTMHMAVDCNADMAADCVACMAVDCTVCTAVNCTACMAKKNDLVAPTHLRAPTTIAP